MATGKLKGKPRVLILGSERPGTLQETQLISDDRQTILSRNTYLATLGELLSGERIEHPDLECTCAGKSGSDDRQ